MRTTGTEPDARAAHLVGSTRIFGGGAPGAGRSPRLIESRAQESR